MVTRGKGLCLFTLESSLEGAVRFDLELTLKHLKPPLTGGELAGPNHRSFDSASCDEEGVGRRLWCDVLQEEPVHVRLPYPVDPDSCRARFSRKLQRLTVKMAAATVGTAQR
jgi:hypothetical protein